MAQEDRVSPNEILAAAGAEKPVTGGTFLQRTGFVLAICVGTLGAVVILTLLVGCLYSLPHPPVIPPNSNSDVAKSILGNYGDLQKAALEPFTTLLDSIVVKILLPVFTSILGYIFGTQANDRK